MWNSEIRNVKQTIRYYGMFQSADSVLVGLSGGPDSVALLHILLEIAPEYSLNIGVAHLNHSLRGESSDRDAEFAGELAKNLNLPYYIGKEDVRNYQIVNKLSLEEAARSVRYAFFKDIAEKNRFSKIALGHHADDNAELTLMYLLRGSGTVGISGIAPVRNFHSIQIVRPLINLTRVQIISFLRKKGLRYVCDESNTETKYLRNRIRHYLLPELKASYNPATVEALNRFSSVIRSEEEWIDRDIIEPLFRDCTVSAEKDKIFISYQKIDRLHIAAKRRIIRKAIASVKGNLRRIAYVHTQAVIALLESKRGMLDLPDGIRVILNNETLTIYREEGIRNRQ